MHYVLSTCVVARKLSGIGLQPGRDPAQWLLRCETRVLRRSRGSRDRHEVHSRCVTTATYQHFPYSARNIATGSMRTAWNTAGNAANSAAARIVTAGSANIAGPPAFT